MRPVPQVDVGKVEDAKTTVEALEAELDENGIDRSGEFWTDLVRRRIGERSPLTGRAFDESPGTVDPRDLNVSLDANSPEQRLIVTAVGHCVGRVSDVLAYGPDERQIWTVDFLALDPGLPVGIGVAVSSVDRTGIVFSGDGGPMMSLQELETAARNDVPMIVVVVNDQSLGAEYHMGRIREYSGSVGRVPAPGFAALAADLGAGGHTARSVADVEDVVQRLNGELTGPPVLDCRVNPNGVHRAMGEMEIAQPSRSNHDLGLWRTKNSRQSQR